MFFAPPADRADKVVRNRVGIQHVAADPAAVALCRLGLVDRGPGRCDAVFDLVVVGVAHRSGGVEHLGGLHLPEEDDVGARVHAAYHLAAEARGGLLADEGNAALVDAGAEGLKFFGVAAAVEPEPADQLHHGRLGEHHRREAARLPDDFGRVVLLVDRDGHLRGRGRYLGQRVDHAAGRDVPAPGRHKVYPIGNPAGDGRVRGRAHGQR